MRLCLSVNEKEAERQARQLDGAGGVCALPLEPRTVDRSRVSMRKVKPKVPCLDHLSSRELPPSVLEAEGNRERS